MTCRHCGQRIHNVTRFGDAVQVWTHGDDADLDHQAEPLDNDGSGDGD
jgi:hypothetical protein